MIVTRRSLLWLSIGVTAWMAGSRMLRRARRMDFAGRTVFITGGSRGLGLLLARRFGAAGARIAICARDPDELERARSLLAAEGADVLALDCDVTQRAAVVQAVDAVQAVWGPVDVLINNAGEIQVGPQEAMLLADYERAMAVHFWGSLHAILAVLPAMQRRGSGRIVNITSIGGKIPVPHLLPYCASKFALTGLSEGLRGELLKDGIYTTTVCPGLMRTGSVRHALFKGRNEAEYAWFSIAAGAPLLTMNADRAAAQILRACRDGRGHVVLSAPARLAALLHAVFPAITGDALAMIDRLLPAADR